MPVSSGAFRGFTLELHDPGIALITFNQPERLNGMTQPMKRDLVEILTQIQMDDAVAVVVFTGSGRAFCAGDDLTGRDVAYANAAALVPNTDHGHHDAISTYNALKTISQQVNRSIRDLDKLTIAAINGVAIQTGLSLALSCDFRLAAESARLGSGTLRFGLLPDEGGHYLLVQLIGLAKTMDFLMRNRIVSAAEALNLGLVSEVMPDSDLAGRAMDLARELANGPRVAMRLLKRCVYHAAEAPLAVSFDEIAAKTGISDHHPDAREGVRAFREKRAPKFNQV